ncbi:MAG TPA: hypothetical protein PKD78_08570, partial [Saprospiraceae bacterium]|nr:hypothetical protein [Saprospiraceae bacterium]
PPSPFAAEEPPAIPPSHAAASAEPLPAAPLPDLPEAPDAPVSPYEQPAPAAPMHEEQPAPAAVSALPEHSAAPASAPAALVATRRPEPPGEGRLADRIRRRLGLSESGPAGGQEVGSSSLAERQSPAPVSTPALVSGGSMQVVAAGQAIQHRSLRHGQHFQVEIPALQRADFQGKTCQVRLTAENLETGETMRLASALAPLPQQALRLPSAGQQLEPGGYRLTAVVHLQADPGQVFFRESRLLVVNAEA